MKRINNKKNLYKSIILLVILVIGIGYAYLTSNLSISGQTEVVANTWNIHFENLNVLEGSVTASTPATIQSNNTDIIYSINLSRPKDYYEFTVDVKNDGTLPGKVSISTLSGLDTISSKVIDYSVTYTNSNSVNVGDILNAGAKKSIKVRVFYKDDISETDFPANDFNLTLTYTLQYIQSEEDAPTIDDLVQDLKSNNSTCFIKYEGQVTDEVGKNVNASNVYLNGCDKMNIIFGGFCWQMIRTTESGGIKMIYNGEVVDGQCDYSRIDSKGIIQDIAHEELLDSNYLYGDSFTYDLTNESFTLLNTRLSTWSDSTYKDLIGKFTCKSNSNTCTTIYEINSYYSNSMAFASSYKIDYTDYSQIGRSAFNANEKSPAMVGYMFNKVYKYAVSSPTIGALMGNDVSYSNGTYTLLPANGESTLGTTLDATHHYTCNDSSGTCSKVRYYYYSGGSFNYYIELDGEANIEEVINNMLYNDNVNKYNSSIKGIIDAWYAQNLSSKTNMLEDTVYCNARNMINQSTNGWNKDGSITTEIQFKNYNLLNDLSCPNITDQFAVGNNKAKLTYPLAILGKEEALVSNIFLVLPNRVRFWNLSPYSFSVDGSKVNYVDNNNRYDNYRTYSPFGLRPVISLKKENIITKGEGSVTNPWVID